MTRKHTPGRRAGGAKVARAPQPRDSDVGRLSHLTRGPATELAGGEVPALGGPPRQPNVSNVHTPAAPVEQGLASAAIKEPAAGPAATAPGTPRHAEEAESPTPSADRVAWDALLQAVLEEKRIINWWSVGSNGKNNGKKNVTKNMEPLLVARIDGDGNCLLKSASRGISGCASDQTLPLALRKALHREMTGPRGGIYRERWETALASRNQADGFELDPSQWNAEWDAQVAAAATTGTSLQEVHVLVLAHVLRRPIIVFSSKVCPCV